MTLLLITEKPSQARAFRAALLNGSTTGTFEGEPIEILHARGHLYEFAQPDKQLVGASESEAAGIKKWSLSTLPWDLSRFGWSLDPIKDTAPLRKELKGAIARADGIVCATDFDPSGEGGMIFGNIVRELGGEKKPLERMYFLDEAPASVQKAFRERKPIASLDSFDEFRMARFRSAWDFASMQFTRIATLSANQQSVLRQGRLKSAMVLLVGDQLKAYNDYVKTVRYQNRFRDENDVMYTDPAEPILDTEAEVPKTYSPSPVVLDKKTMKRTAPPKFLDLAALSARLGSKGHKAAAVLKVYQAMYEKTIVSYPRTEDKFISNEQFKEMLPIVDSIAAVVGVDPGVLTHRAPRATHVKDGGAHGANRPGMKVPESLQWLETTFGRLGRDIYEEVARSFLASLAEDYEYESQEGHLEKYPSFLGRTSVPKAQGWKDVFDAQGDDDEDSATQGLGSTAEPFVHEVIPPRPAHPTMKWLMKQLEKGDGTPIGTGATRTSTFAEITAEQTATNKYPLMAERRGKVTFTEFGEMSYLMLPGTNIGSLGVTSMVFDTMKLVADGSTGFDAEIAKIAALVQEDLVTMAANGQAMRQALGLPDVPPPSDRERVTGTFAKTGEEKSFNRTWGANEHWDGHRFTDEEVDKLFKGEIIEFPATSRAGKPYKAVGNLQADSFKGRPTFGFKLDFGDPNKVPDEVCKRPFSADEKRRLEAGEKLFLTGFTSKSGNPFDATVAFEKAKSGPGKRIVFDFGKK